MIKDSYKINNKITIYPGDILSITAPPINNKKDIMIIGILKEKECTILIPEPFKNISNPVYRTISYKNIKEITTSWKWSYIGNVIDDTFPSFIWKLQYASMITKFNHLYNKHLDL